MKSYLIARHPNGELVLTCQALVKGAIVESVDTGPFDIGNDSDETKALALAIMRHYFGASEEDAGAAAEAERKTVPFLEAFLLHHAMRPGARLEIPSDVIDRFFSL